ncbi:MAG: DUF4332 domain-containing protein [Chitinophagales bacterium]
MASYKISAIESLDADMEAKFIAAGIKTVEKLLERGASKEGRKELAKELDIDAKQLLIFVNNADLFRVRGISTQYADLLKASGVDTVKELRNRKPENLQAKMASVNADNQFVRQLPTVNMVVKYVEHAKELPPVVTY